ncbi:hypothetical protein K1719_034312 [Acacia pycnantha]|nr:hypothetical protein K1719_034312 [Acacia pycnantha]
MGLPPGVTMSRANHIATMGPCHLTSAVPHVTATSCLRQHIVKRKNIETRASCDAACSGVADVRHPLSDHPIVNHSDADHSSHPARECGQGSFAWDRESSVSLSGVLVSCDALLANFWRFFTAVIRLFDDE